MIQPSNLTRTAPALERSAAGGMAHHFTVDVEEYFQVSALEGVVSRSGWADFESRVRPATERILALLARAGARGTFFVLGWTASRIPELVPAIRAAGHEVASHGWDHRRIPDQSPRAFRESARRSKALLEDQAGAPVRGFRAPSFSILPGYEWALDVLIEEGYAYDSSFFPIRRPGYGYPAAPPDPYLIQRPGGVLHEFPLTTLRRFGARIPAAGGAYFRLLPYGVVATALTDCGRRGVPGNFYIHPWELDTEQPRLPVSRLTRLRHYGGLGHTGPRLERLLSEFRFTSIAATLDTRG
jgi:polysaccharide deacetylase family protein (PEP-CTERM system associated)